MQEISSYLQHLWLNSKESDVYVTLWKLWSHPASTIASVAGYERVWTYKTLQKFVTMGIVAETLSKWVTHFRIPSLDLLSSYIERNQQAWKSLEEQFTYVKTAFLSLPNHQQLSVPKIQLFEQTEGIKNLFTDAIQTIHDQGLITIKLFATNTFETQMLSNTTLHTYAQDFFDTLKKQNVSVTSFIAEWSLIMEHLSIWDHTKQLESLPAGNNAVHILLIGKSVYIMIYKELPIGIKLDSPEFARAMHFLLEQTVKY